MLSFQLDHCQQICSLVGLQMAQNVKDINHAQFFDDTRLLGGASIISVGLFKRELEIYKEVSGSKIRDMTGIARLLGMEGTLSWDYFKYIGIPILKSAPKVAH